MALVDAPRFAIEPAGVAADQVAALVSPHAEALSSGDWVYCGYGPMAGVPGLRPPSLDVTARVDGQFRLEPLLGFETSPAVVTVALRSSRFAPLVFWEVLHALRPGGLWIDVDVAGRCEGTPLCSDDVPRREYFRSCLAVERDETAAGVRCQVFRKTGPSPAATRAGDRGWTFGILTSGPSPRAAQMARDLLTLDLPAIEVIVCGPRPEGVPDDPRVRQIDLERPEPRGWITRKKNLLVGAASHEQVCLLHDRYVVTPGWAPALRSMGRAIGVCTFPQVFYADADRQFPQRYAEYQVLHQQQGLRDALASGVYAGEHILYSPLDDFSETAFCCGGLYVTTRTVWARVGQDEALYHCEWEDVSFGLDCQRRGIPHRVSRALTVESATPHPMALTRRHDLLPTGTVARGRLHVRPEQEDAARRAPARFRPILGASRDAYYARVRTRFNAIPGLGEAHRLDLADTAGCAGLADFWRVVEQRVAALPLTDRADLAAVLFFLSDTVYNWPNCEVQSWIRANARAVGGTRPLDRFGRVAGWGTGSLFHAAHGAIGRRLDQLVDGDAGRWGSSVAGYTVSNPEALRACDAADTAVVVFSCAFDAIVPRVRAIGPFQVFRVDEVAPRRRFAPLSDLVGYFEEVERYYPAVFAS
jgi:hypothetical protein